MLKERTVSGSRKLLKMFTFVLILNKYYLLAGKGRRAEILVGDNRCMICDYVSFVFSIFCVCSVLASVPVPRAALQYCQCSSNGHVINTW